MTLIRTFDFQIDQFRQDYNNMLALAKLWRQVAIQSLQIATAARVREAEALEELNRVYHLAQAGMDWKVEAERYTVLWPNSRIDSQVEFTNQATQNWPSGVTDAASAICVEAGQVAEMVKKHLGHGHALDKPAVAERLNAILAYIGQIGLVFKVSMAEIAKKDLTRRPVLEVAHG